MAWTVALPSPAIEWEVRSAWATRRPVVLVLDRERTVAPRVVGSVAHVASSGAFALLRDGGPEPVHVPLALVLAVRSPHFSEPGTPRDLEPAVPNQPPLGHDRARRVSVAATRLMERAVGELMPDELLDALAALDAAATALGARPSEVARVSGRSERRTRADLRELHRRGYVVARRRRTGGVRYSVAVP